MHVFFGYPNDLALLNDLGIDSNNMLNDLEIFHCNLRTISKAQANQETISSYQRLYALRKFPLDNLLFVQVD